MGGRRPTDGRHACGTRPGTTVAGDAVTPAVLGGKTLLAGTIGGVSGLLLQLATEADHVSLAGIAAGFATRASALLFGRFIKQGNPPAPLQTRAGGRKPNGAP